MKLVQLNDRGDYKLTTNSGLALAFITMNLVNDDDEVKEWIINQLGGLTPVAVDAGQRLSYCTCGQTPGRPVCPPGRSNGR